MASGMQRKTSENNSLVERYRKILAHKMKNTLEVKMANFLGNTNFILGGRKPSIRGKLASGKETLIEYKNLNGQVAH
jgi:hypothetical protein